MKLESVNGNLMSLTMKVTQAQAQAQAQVQAQEREQQQQNQKAESQDALLAVGGGECDGEGEGEGGAETESEEHKLNGEEGEGGESEVDKETIGAGGKKKGTRKKRSLNWEEAERGLLLEALKPKVEYVENRSVDAKSIKAKRLAWMQITKQFNALNFRHRSLEQIQVQWRSMKNSAKREYQQKHPKASTVEGMDMIEFMEELQKDPTNVRNQTRSGGANGGIKKEQLLDIDDEDTPLAALPTSAHTNTSEDTIQSSTLALPSPPPSADSSSQHHEGAQMQQQQNAPGRYRKKGPHANSSSTSSQLKLATPTGVGKTKRQRLQASTQVDPSTNASGNSNDAPTTTPTNILAATLNAGAIVAHSPSPTMDEGKYKKQLYELIKRARLAEMDYARREHEQKLRFEQLEQELKLDYCRRLEEQKLRQSREEHEQRMRHCQLEHEARLRVFTLSSIKNNKLETKSNTNVEPSDGSNSNNANNCD